MSGLINPTLLKSNLLFETLNVKPPESMFHNIFTSYVILNYILPIICIIILALFLKSRYKEKLRKMKGRE